MVKKIFIITGIALLCFIIPISCSLCTVKAEENNNTVVLSSTNNSIDASGEIYYLLGNIPYQHSNRTMSISTNAVVLYNSKITNNVTDNIYETFMVLPIRKGNTELGVLQVSLGLSGADYGSIPTQPATASNISFHSAIGSPLDNTFSLQTEIYLYQQDSNINTYCDTFEDVMRFTTKVKRFSYKHNGYYYTAFEFYNDSNEKMVLIYFQLPLEEQDMLVDGYESWSFPQASLDIRDFIGAEENNAYNEGFKDGYNSREPFFTIVKGVNEFLHIEMFGGFTIGTMFGIVVALSMLFIGLHLFRG